MCKRWDDLMQRVYDLHKIVARIGLLGMPSQAHHELPQRKHQRLVQRQHRVVLKLGEINPLDRLSLPPIWITRPHLAGEEEEYDLSIASRESKVAIHRPVGVDGDRCVRCRSSSQARRGTSSRPARHRLPTPTHASRCSPRSATKRPRCVRRPFCPATVVESLFHCSW